MPRQLPHRPPPPSAVAKHSSKKPFSKAVIAAVAVIAVVAIAVGAFVLSRPSTTEDSNSDEPSATTPAETKDFNGTVTIDRSDSENEIQSSMRITAKDDKMTVDIEDILNGSSVIDKNRSYTATIAERSETETAYVFKLKDAKTDNGDELYASNYCDDVQFTLYIPKGMKGQKPEGFFGATVRYKDANNDGKYYFHTSDLKSLPFMQFNADGKGTFFEINGYGLENTDDVSKIDPTSEDYDKDFGSSNVDADKETFKWEKRDNKLHCTWEEEGSYNNFDITVTD